MNPLFDVNRRILSGLWFYKFTFIKDQFIEIIVDQKKMRADLKQS